MTYDINSYEIFLHGEYNPLAESALDDDAIKAEVKFHYQLENYVESHFVTIKVDYSKILEDSNYIINLLEKLNFTDLGFHENDNISIEIDPEEIDENNNIEICLKSESKGEFPSLESEKIRFYDKLMIEIKEGVKKDLKETTLNFPTEERVKVYINQQYQFGLNYIKEFYQRRRLIGELGKSMDKIRKVKSPNETNSNIITFIISDVLNILDYIENNYKYYISTELINQKNQTNILKTKRQDKEIANEKSKWKKWFDVQLLELKPNFMGLGLNVNAILKRMKEK